VLLVRSMPKRMNSSLFAVLMKVYILVGLSMAENGQTDTFYLVEMVPLRSDDIKGDRRV